MTDVLFSCGRLALCNEYRSSSERHPCAAGEAILVLHSKPIAR